MAKDKKKVNSNDDKKNKKFWKGYKSELKKVKWPTPKELFNSTVAVIAIVVIVAVIVIVLDLAFEGLNKLEVKGIEGLQNSIVTENTINSNEITENELNAAENTVE